MNLPQRVLGVLDSHGRRLHRMLYRLTLREDAAEELLQDLAVKLLSKEAAAKADDLAAYAFRSAVNLGCDWRRKQRRAKPTVPLPTLLPSAEAAPSQSLERHEQRARILDILEEVSELTRLCLVLRYLEEEPVEAIAKQVGKTPHQVRAICAKGVAKLRETLGSRSEDKN